MFSAGERPSGLLDGIATPQQLSDLARQPVFVGSGAIFGNLLGDPIPLCLVFARPADLALGRGAD